MKIQKIVCDECKQEGNGRVFEAQPGTFARVIETTRDPWTETTAAKIEADREHLCSPQCYLTMVNRVVTAAWIGSKPAGRPVEDSTPSEEAKP